MNDDMPWLNLTPEEIQELRANKKELSDYAMQRIKDLMMNQESYPDEMFEEAERREKENKVLKIAKQGIKENKEALEQLAEIERKEFYRFFAVEYYGTGEGISYWLKICRNYPPYNGEDIDLECFKKFIGDAYHSEFIQEPTEEEFMSRYVNLIPSHIVKMVERKDQPELIWETYFHVNYN
jgi:hypothetical protein